MNITFSLNEQFYHFYFQVYVFALGKSLIYTSEYGLNLDEVRLLKCC